MRTIAKSILFPVYMVLPILISSCEMKHDVNDQTVDPGEPVNIPIEIHQKGVIDSANCFAFDLYKTILDDSESKGNIIISPFSISCALSMALNGAMEETYEAMSMTLGVEDKTLTQINDTYLKLLNEMIPVDERVLLEITNSVWVEKRLIVRQEFIDDMVYWYNTEVLGIDIKDPDAVNKVNKWIAEKTHDKITNMIDRLDPQLALLLINAVYFKGMWTYQFDAANTEKEPFYIAPSVPVNAHMMHQTVNLKAARVNNVTIVDIPYGRGNYSMLVVLPDEDVALSDVTDALTSTRWNNWLDYLSNAGAYSIELSMPRFKYKFHKLLNTELKKLGMGIAFSDTANFHNISSCQELMISRVIHESFIENNEEGTEAAAATIVEIVFKSGGPPPISRIEINRPFLYFIHENSTGTILFMGQVIDPSDMN